MYKWQTSAFLYDEEGNTYWDEILVETETMDIDAMKRKALKNPWVQKLGFESWVLSPNGTQRYVLF